MRILTHILEINSTSVGPEPTFTVHLVFASNLKKYYPNKFKFTCLFHLLFSKRQKYFPSSAYSLLMPLLRHIDKYEPTILFTTHWTLISTRKVTTSLLQTASDNTESIKIEYQKLNQICYGTIYKRLWMILQLPHWLQMFLKTQMICYYCTAFKKNTDKRRWIFNIWRKRFSTETYNSLDF